jgi:hypothetical protein
LDMLTEHNCNKYSGPQKWDNGLRCVSQKKEAQIGQEKT